MSQAHGFAHIMFNIAIHARTITGLDKVVKQPMLTYGNVVAIYALFALNHLSHYCIVYVMLHAGSTAQHVIFPTPEWQGC
jgi:hypothetical protein